MTDFFQKRGREKLYKQWIEKAGLSPDNLPEDLKKQTAESGGTDDGSSDQTGPGGVFPRGARRPGAGSYAFVSGRLLVILVSIIMVLLVVVSILSTVLALRGC